MKITFRGQELELHYGMRIYIIYENIMGNTVDFKDLTKFTSIITLFYSAVVATLQYNKMNTDVTYDEFIDWIDIDTTNKIKEFSEWFVKNLEAQNDRIDVTQEKKIEERKDHKKPKK